MVLLVKFPVHPSLSHNSPTIAKNSMVDGDIGYPIIISQSFHNIPTHCVISHFLFGQLLPCFHPIPSIRHKKPPSGASPLASPYRNDAGESLGFGTLSWGKVSSGMAVHWWIEILGEYGECCKWIRLEKYPKYPSHPWWLMTKNQRELTEGWESALNQVVLLVAMDLMLQPDKQLSRSQICQGRGEERWENLSDSTNSTSCRVDFMARELSTRPMLLRLAPCEGEFLAWEALNARVEDITFKELLVTNIYKWHQVT